MLEYLPLYAHAALLTLRIGWIGIAGLDRHRTGFGTRHLLPSSDPA